MKLNQLNALIKVADAGSIQAAARALFVTQPAVSRAIRDLEVELGTLLIKRSTKGVSLTPAGTVLLQRARVASQALSLAAQEIASMRSGSAVGLVIGAAPIAMETFLGPAVQKFLALYPDVRLSLLEMRPDAIRESLRNGRIDVGFGHLVDRFPEFQHQPLCRFPTTIMARKSHPLPIDAQAGDFERAEWIFRSPELEIDEIFTRNSLNPPLRYTLCTSNPLSRQLLLNRDLLIMVTIQMLDSDHRADFKFYEFPGILPTRDVYASYRDSELHSWPCKKLLSWVESVIAERYQPFAAS